MISLRSLSFGACNEIAKATSIWPIICSKPETTPEVETVTRRLERPKPRSSSMISNAGMRFFMLSKGSPMPIITTLVIGRRPVSFSRPISRAARQT
ncbi:Uncharacterised protein [Vibrio cholerae]|nr:Uncharacterised protein [Vibrio cholerae]CSB48542.1 Uncharacterised protein [Vibrio cholerae]CSI33393.1 Uncharacterised protein [Vibrio cholerae]